MKKASTKDHGLSDCELQVMFTVLTDYWQKIEKVCLFGSRACGQYKDYSDIDLVLYGKLAEEDVDRLRTLFDDSNLGVSVDLQAYDYIKYQPLKRHIESMGKILFTNE